MGPTAPLTTQQMAAVTKAFRVPASLAAHSRVITMNFCLEDRVREHAPDPQKSRCLSRDPQGLSTLKHLSESHSFWWLSNIPPYAVHVGLPVHLLMDTWLFSPVDSPGNTGVWIFPRSLRVLVGCLYLLWRMSVPALSRFSIGLLCCWVLCISSGIPLLNV